MVSGNVGLIFVVGLFVVMSVTAIYIFQAQGGMEVFNPEKFQGIAGLAGMFTSPGGSGIESGSFGTGGMGESINGSSEALQTNSNTLIYYCDIDKDGYFNKFPTSCGGSACSLPNGCVLVKPVTSQADCKDNDAKINPGAAEIAGNGKDENCDGRDTSSSGESETGGSSGSGDSGLGAGSSGTTTTQKYYCDNDEDGYFDSTSFTCNTANCVPFHCTTAVPVYPDCNDNDLNSHPSATEVCDGYDNDCDKYVDENEAVGCTMYYYDGDQDGYGNLEISKCSCSKPSSSYVTNSLDCKDTQDAIYPGATETCNIKDDDCDGQVDEGNICSSTIYYCDEDHDGYTSSVAHTCTGSNCVPSYCYSFTTTIDCNDNNFDISPGKTETCNGVDDNCDGVIDPQDSNNCKSYFYDGDQDGYGTAASFCLCVPTGAYTAIKTGDCNSNTAEANPGQIEKCDSIDNDCDGQIDEFQSLGCTVYYYDFDGDGWGISTSKCLCSAGGASKSEMYYTATAKPRTDCNDANPEINPGVSEAYPGKSEEGCSNLIDDDCDGKIDMNDPDCQVPV